MKVNVKYGIERNSSVRSHCTATKYWTFAGYKLYDFVTGTSQAVFGAEPELQVAFVGIFTDNWGALPAESTAPHAFIQFINQVYIIINQQFFQLKLITFHKLYHFL